MDGLFRRLLDGQTVDAGNHSEDGISEVALIASIADDSGLDDGTAKSTYQLPHRIESGTANALEASTILLGNLWDDDESDRHRSVNSQVMPTKGSNSGSSARD
ncbi:MAG: hypothetical protein M1824_001885 [Vezdaea acicularis]|nr:MAG: hypothetical protein M1824_001885 [Vezdaea acicularis]